jgi:hypothetical protein
LDRTQLAGGDAHPGFCIKNLKFNWILPQKFEVPRWPWRIKAIVLVCESTTITNGVRDSGTGPARFPVRG